MPIDGISTQDMINIMVAYTEGKKIEYRVKKSIADWIYDERPLWDWDNLIFREKPKEKWIDKLFVNCPIVFFDDQGITFRYKPTTNRKFRLPSIEESPKNVWLCPPDKMPDFGVKRIILRNKLNNTWENELNTALTGWNNVTAFRILEDLN